ncbi:BamA/TamA family outer membrane protein [Niastella populi]|uniref:Metallophosphoesterase n=1 Tax=Niastella populi TaxID=550983 RepID=A0A1V9GBV5_9BACT|nr:BamA/TamA family outer membrane protein [Niastella populi]OQP67926.1 metallophosphoesterase [Niastella populi]
MKYLFGFIMVFAAHVIFAQTNDSVTARIILIGDGGALINGKHPVASAVKNQLLPDKKTTIVYLGDNLYRHGLPDEGNVNYVLSRTVLDSQIAVAANTPAHVYMIPGNHDWSNGGADGWASLLRQEAYVNLMREKNVEFLPSEGCPGPVEVPIGNDVVMVVFDSQWFLHPHDKPGIEWDCPCKTESEFKLQLQEILQKNYNKLIIMACHHPFMSNGIHGGYFGIKQHIFPFTDLRKKLYIPLPVIGSIYPISRSVFGSPQDISYPAYTNMVNTIRAETRQHPNVIYAAGHDHSLQLLQDTSHYYIVSGSGCQTSRVENSKNSLFTEAVLGFAVLEVSKNKNVTAKFYSVNADSATATETFAKNIIDFSKPPALAKDTAQLKIPPYTDYYVATASKQYTNPSTMRKLILGKNYRDVWSQPVKLKVFRLKEEHGGFKIKAMGGGKQTKSLTLEDKNGKLWSLRTIDKDPEMALPENLRNTVASEIIQDMISAAHPYAPLPVAALAKAANIPHAKPEFFLVPNDVDFGRYRPVFANKVCMLEEKDASWDGSDTKSTITVFNNIIEDNDKRVVQNEVLKVRLLDILIADWDRHFDQFKWGVRDTGEGKLYYPIPKDRDQAFFRSEGWLVDYVSKKRLPFLKGLRYKIPDVIHLTAVSKDFDRLFLNDIDRKEWDSVTTVFRKQLPDTVIIDAVKKMPPEIYALNGKKITDKLISRRNELGKASLKYYDFLAKQVNILGSNEKELFKVFNEGKNIRVQVLSRQGKDSGFVMYDRLFDPNRTKELRFYGFRGNDKFDINAKTTDKTFFRIIGGKGDDTFHINSNIKSYVYDLSTEKNFLAKGGNTKPRFSTDTKVNDYDINEFQYDIFHFPRINVGWNADDGFMFGFGLWYRRYGWRKKPYSSEQRLSALFAAAHRASQVKYRGLFVDVFPKWDIVVNAELMNPALNNFFGFGNNTKVSEDTTIRYYRARFKNVAADVLFRKKIAGVFSVFAGPSFYHYWNEQDRNKDYILGKPSLVGLDSSNIYSVKSYAGAKLGFYINNLNDELFPTRGISWLSTFTQMQPLNDNSSPLTKLESDMTVYASMSFPARWVTVLRVGGGHIYSDSLEYFQALTLGANNFLRGFRKNRFAGTGLAYASLEFRVKLFDSKSYVFPGQVGLVAFNDIGRVWLKGERSRLWHYAYGGGFYYVPYNMVLVSATVALSNEERLVNFTLGTKLNLTF